MTIPATAAAPSTPAPTLGATLREWTGRHRRIDGELPFLLDDYPYLRELYEDPAPHVVIMKAGQVGVTEYGINRALWTTCELGGNVLFVLPTLSPAASDFSQARLKSAIEDSPEILERAGGIDNVGLKRVGLGLIYCRGSERRATLKEMPIDFVVVEEYDECNQKNLPFAFRRLDHSTLKHRLLISNPTLPGAGIDALYEQSDQRRWHVRCAGCGQEQPLSFDRNLIVGTQEAPAYWGCASCQAPLDRTQGRWVAAYPDRAVRGYHITQALSPRVTPQELLDDWRAAEGDTFKEQGFYNMRRGEAYAAKGQQIDDALLRSLVADYFPLASGRGCSMGVDVGAVLHVRISQRAEGDLRQAVHTTTVKEFTELDALMRTYQVAGCVVDALPETREARKFQERHRGRVWLAYYHDNAKTPTAVWGEQGTAHEGTVRLHRTQACDAMRDRMLNRRLLLPKNAATLEPRDARTGLSHWFQHLTAPVRVRRQDARGTENTTWVTPGDRPDHFFHAEVYDEMAFTWIHEVLRKRPVVVGH
jgi:hypothetical protein